MRGSVFGSALVHLTVVAVLFLFRQNAPVIVPGPEVVQVALLDPTQAMTPPAPAPAPQVIEREPEVKPTDDEGVRIQKPEAKPKPKETRREEPPREAPAVPALPYAAIGPPGLRGQVSVDAADFEFTYYLMLVRNRIAQNWTPPGGLAGSGQQAVVYFRIARNGAILGPRLETVSGADFFDRAALRAVQISDPLPPLPLGFPGRDLGVHFGFQYTGS